MNTPKNFIGIDALQQVANQVFKSVVMGPQYAAPEDMPTSRPSCLANWRAPLKASSFETGMTVSMASL